jgi:hypothetical protein
MLSEIGMSPLEAGDFTLAENRQIFLAIDALPDRSTGLSSETLRAGLIDTVAEHLDRLLQYWNTVPVTPEDLAESEAVRSILKLRQQVIGKWLTELHALLGDAEDEGDSSTAASYGHLVRTYAQEKMILQQLIRSKNLAKQPELTRRYSAVTTEGT